MIRYCFVDTMSGALHLWDLFSALYIASDLLLDINCFCINFQVFLIEPSQCLPPSTGLLLHTSPIHIRQCLNSASVATSQSKGADGTTTCGGALTRRTHDVEETWKTTVSNWVNWMRIFMPTQWKFERLAFPSFLFHLPSLYKPSRATVGRGTST